MGTVELILFAIMGLLLLGMIGLSIFALTRMNEISQRLNENTRVQQGTTESFAEIQRTLGQLTEDGRRMEEVSKEVSGLSDIASKYILPDEGTFDFALMYIPAENVYYETIIKDEQLGDDASILSHAMQKHVIPVSPNSFYAYLQAIALGFRGLQIEKQAKEIMGFLDRLMGDIGRFRADYNTLGGHLENARKKYDEAERRLGRFEEKLGSARESRTSISGQERARLESDLD
ncbi:MAG: DNA recombination protein RmuC [Chloroflexi bacterium]|nr:DNA recombination protein RmuC [Chloroflexota bacterium]